MIIQFCSLPLIIYQPVESSLIITQNIEANAILYFVLQDGQTLARELNRTSTTIKWNEIAARLKTAANQLLWDEEVGLYRDNETTTLHPQDGNAWAIKANLTSSTDQSIAISRALQSRWGLTGRPRQRLVRRSHPSSAGSSCKPTI